MLPDDKKRLLLMNIEQKSCDAKIAIGDPHVICFDRRDHLAQQRALLGMTIRTGKDISGSTQLRIKDHQRFTGQRAGRRRTQWFQAMLAGGQAIPSKYFNRYPGSNGGRAPFIVTIKVWASWAM